ncbi:MAG: tRNA (N6-threonylcarbamoyladenosine(37)-N6)-methyltransferase TrmO [Acidimicrobiales bacterium]|nr:tRNA (N6-threonylcarbamoyladenosine(37)-N6)-methyltransferase TrmO [Acidimicrobiales bacterium]
MPASPLDDTPTLRPVGTVASPLGDAAGAPRQPDEGAPPAAIVILPEYEAALAGMAAGDRIVVLTWLHVADRATLSVHPRDDPAREPIGVFATRSPDRPNPVGLHEVTVVAVDGTRITVDGLEAFDGTPVIDLKPVLGPIDDR